MTFRTFIYFGLAVMGFSSYVLACASCGCSLDTEAVTGFGAQKGLSLGLEYDDINQSQYRHNSHTAELAQIINTPAQAGATGAEIEKGTINRYLNVSLNERFNSRWDMTLLLPWVDRTHSTYGQQNQPYTAMESSPGQVSSAYVDALGDIKILGTYQGLLPTHNLGLEFGLKLPTGNYGGGSQTQHYGHPVNFISGPMTQSPLDASLQAGTGSTDLLVGGYYFQALSQDIDGFINTVYQSALWHHLHQPGGSYRPGDLFSLSLGFKEVALGFWSPQLQVNVIDRRHDQGELADSLDTAGKVFYLSPGLSFSLNRTYLYGFVQLPLYSQLSGYQLFPRWTASLGLSQKF